MLCKFVSVSLSPSLSRSSLSPASAASLGAFFSFSFCHLYGLFSFLHLQGCLQQSPGRQSYLEAQPALLLSLGYVPAQTLGWSRARVRSPAPQAALPRAQPVLALAGAGQSPGPAGRAGQGQLQELGCEQALGEVCSVHALSEVECY